MSLSGIWTAKGIDKLAAQTAGGPALTIDKIALGDGGGIVPAVLPSQAALLKEVWRGLVNAVLVEPDTPNAVTVEAVIPYSVGGFHIREWGIYDVEGDLIAVGPHAEFYKPLLAEGSGAELLERIQLPLSNAGQVNLTISSEALATRKYVDQTAKAKAEAAVAQHDGDTAAHGGHIDALLKRKINTTAPLTGGGDLSKDLTLKINATAAPTANNVILRDVAGRAQVAAPAAAADIARKADVDALAARSITVSAPLTGGGNLTANRAIGIKAASAATANYVILRDAAGRAQVAAPAAAADIARKADVDAVCGVLPGSVLAFSGAFGGNSNRHPIPRGGTQPDSAWILCDGGSDGAGGKVPDLRGRMIMGAGGSYAAEATGGAETHNHSITGTVGATTLTEAQLASHGHAILTTTVGVNGWEYNPFGRGTTTGTNSSSIQSTGGSKSHTHALTARSGEASSLPPYYALAYIMRIA